MSKAPAESPVGSKHHTGLAIVSLFGVARDEKSAHEMFAAWRWAENGRSCPRCGSAETSEQLGAMGYWCKHCRRRFSVRTATALECSNITLLKWIKAIYITASSPEGVSSTKLHRDLNISQKSAWHMLHRISETWTEAGGEFRRRAHSGKVHAADTPINLRHPVKPGDQKK